MRTNKGRVRRVVLFLSALAAVAAPTLAGGAPGAPRVRDVFSRAGFRGSGPAMQPVNLPARVARVTVVPGTAEAWGIGLSSAIVPGWDARSPGGQVVFLRYTSAGGWSMAGPPVDASGTVVNPTLTALAMAANGEGWAVGEDGVLIHRAPGGPWRLHPSSGIVSVTLQSISVGIGPDHALFGYAAGDAGEVIRLSGGRWQIDTGAAAITDDLVSVSALSADDAWAVSGSSSSILKIYHRTGGVWGLQRTGRAMFDSPPAKTEGGATNNSARGAAIAATSFGVWVTGAIVPSDASHPFGDDAAGDNSRPFAIWMAGNEVTTYCPDQYSLGQAGNVNVSRLCDRPFPQSAFDLASITAFPGPDGGEAFAGGLGLFHFRGGGWFREPDANGYLISVGFSTPREGWAASSGNTYGAGGAAQSSTTVIGHWTARPAKPHVARWGQPNQKVLEAVATDPGGHRAIAVGQQGGSVLYEDGAWDRLLLPTQQALHGVAWPGAVAWAVGSRGTIARFDGAKWSFPIEPGAITGRALFGVAFRNPGDGVAVGEDGTILRYSGGRWSLDPDSGSITQRSLFAVAAAGSGYVAVGEQGTVLVRDASGWQLVPGLAELLRRGARPPADLFSVSSLGGGEVIAGGANSSLLLGGAEGFRSFPSPLEGSVLAVAGSRLSDGRIRLLASIGSEADKYLGDRLSVSSGGLVAFDGTRWTDVQLSSRRTIFSTYEPSQPVDPAFAVALEPGAVRGWAVGGTIANNVDPDNHIQSDSTSSVYRFDMLRDAAQPGTTALPRVPSSGITFAFFGETGCALALCDAAIGSGIAGDVVGMQIQDEINTLAGQRNGPGFVLFGGNMRRVGLPEEVGQFRGFMRGFRPPLFGAIGDQDLFIPTQVPTPSGSAGGIIRSQLPSNNDFWKDTFADQLAPWGTTGRRHPLIKPVEEAGDQSPLSGLARTHYAFDYVVGGKQVLRVAVLDSSNRNLSSQGQNPNEGQIDWLTRVLAPTRVTGEPSIVVLNQPTFNTTRGYQQPNWSATQDSAAFHGAIVANGVSAVLSSGIRVNLVYSASAQGTPGSVPFYVFGGGGMPLEETKHPLDGFYHSWQLVTVDPSDRIQPLDQARVKVQSIPVLESIALHAEDGRTAHAGNALEFSALARAPFGGTSDIDQSHATYFTFPGVQLCSFSPSGLQRGGCASREAVHPSYRFSTSDPSVARFVRPLIGKPGFPARDVEGNLIPDEVSGFLCTLKTGRVTVSVEAGLRRAQMPISVTGGFGPCVEKPVLNPPIVERPEAPPVVQQTEPKVIQPFRPQVQQQAVAVFPPPPAPVVAPAPPGAPGIGRKEEHQVSHETEGHGPQAGRHLSTALVRQRPDPVEQSWPTLGIVAALSFMSAAVAVGSRQRRLEWQREHVQR